MTPAFEAEVAANLERAEQSIRAAKDLAAKGYYDFAASRAYYAAFYGAAYGGAAVLLETMHEESTTECWE
ncbi:HEPN domain-containing protein [Chloracidobacterium sp. MS 40/45]|uniref:HEPN domain-containing protein n=1 Tax=Chloracidobacterium aggregatum TaxID=2851959 RepID=UPI001B8C8448|nr:HEPN domain-containing protein [Chloracidobacterium aggregatum]QUW00254.1 HEPN domain-containing protein [Chloracidobacterium sp. MS 40/45]